MDIYHWFFLFWYPTGPFTIMEPQEQEKSIVRRIFEAQKLWKGRSGIVYFPFPIAN